MEGTQGLLAIFTIATCFLVNGGHKTVCKEEAVADIVFLVDGSWSIGSENFKQIRQFLYTLVNSFNVAPDQVRIGLVQYSSTPRTEFLLNTFQDKQDILQYINNLPYMGGETNTGLGLDFLLNELFVDRTGSRVNENVPQIAVVITDGESMDNVGLHALKLKKQGITLYAIGIKEADEDQLKEIATTPHNQHVYSVSDFAALQGISQSLIQVLCTTIDEAKRPISKVVQECLNATVADIVFLVDGSTSISHTNFQEVRRFLHSFIKGLDIGADKVRVGLAQFSNVIQKQFHLGEHTDQMALLEQVDKFPQLGGGTDTGKAITVLREEFFTKANGSRADQRVPQIAVVLTDGESADDVVLPAKALRQHGVIVFAIGVGAANINKLKDIANRPHEHFLVNIESFQALQTLSQGLLQTVCVSMENQRMVCKEEAVADIVFLVDGSWSIGSENFKQIRQFLYTLVNSFNVAPDQVRIGLVQYSSTPRTEFLLNTFQDKQDILQYINNLPYMGGETNTGLGLDFLLNELFVDRTGSRVNENVPQIAVVITDGESMDNVGLHALKLKKQGITLYAIGIKEADEDQLKEIATTPHNQHVYSVSDFAALQGISQSLIQVLCTTIDEAKRPISKVVQECLNATVADIVFLVDGSTSISHTNFQEVRRFLHSFIKGLDIGADKVRVGLAQFSNVIQKQFHLGEHTDQMALLEQVDKFPQLGGGTDTGKAITVLREEFFTKANGSRADQRVPQIAVVLTDGESADDVVLPAKALRQHGVIVFAIGVGAANINKLKDIANRPHEHFLVNIESFQALQTLSQGLLQTVCVSMENQRMVCKEEAVADIVFLVEGSWSIGSENFKQIRQFLYTLVNSFNVAPDQVRIGLVQYSSTPRTEFLLNTFQDKQDILQYINNLPYMGGETNTGLGLDFLLNELFVDRTGSRVNENVPQIAVVITDGESMDNVGLHALKLKKQGITLYAIGIKEADEDQLKEIATTPHNQHVYSVSDFAALQGISQSLIQVLCTTIDEAKRPISKVVQECLNATVADIVFLVDGSTSISHTNFQEVRRFLHSFIKGLDIGADKVRVGLAQFSNVIQKQFHLGEHTDQMALLEQVDKFPQLGGGTDTGKAITVLREEFFTKANGSRADQRVPQIAVVLTDGESADDVVLPAKALRQHGVIVFAIGVGAANINKLKDIANRPHEHFLVNIESFQALQTLSQGLLQTVCVSMENQRMALIPKFSDIFFLVDSNMTQADFKQVRNLLMRLVNQLNPSTKTMRLGLAQFAQDTKVEFLLNTHNTKEEYLAALRKFRLPLRPNRSRHLGDALEYTRAHFFTTASGGRNEQGYRQFLVTVTGGDSKDNIMKVARTIKSEGTTIVSIGLGESTLPELKVMATSPFFYQTTPIASVLKTVFETEEVVTVTDDCSEASLADIVFIVDESSSSRTANFQLVRGFIHKIVDGLDMDFNRVRVGIVLYSNKASAQVYLNSFQEKTNILQFIKILPYRHSLTYTGEALKYAREKIFIKEKGSRKEQGVQQVAIVITGKSQDNVTFPAAALRRAGVTVYAVGIKDAEENELRQIASDPPNKHVLHVDSFAKLKTLEKSLKKRVCYNILKKAVKDNARTYTAKQSCLQTDEADIFFLIDQSSIEYPDLADMKTFINEFIHTFHIGPHHVRVGVVKFSHTPTLEFDLTTYPDKPSVEKAVDGITQLGGGTRTRLELTSMGPYFDRAKATRSHKVREYLIVITDGECQDNVKDQAAKLRAQGITIYAIGVKLANDTQLLEIAGSQEKKFFVNNFDALKPIKNDIITDICSPDICKDMMGDVLFLIDSSGSINNADFQKMKVFMQSIINKSDIGLDKVHVGIIQFSTSQQIIFPLNKYNDKEGMLQDLQTMQQIGGGTHTGKALSYTSQFFDPPKGGRTNVKQFLIVVTDGEAQDKVKSPAKKLRDKGVIIYTIGVVNANNTQLLEISGAQERVYSENDFDALKALDSQLALAICDPERECVRTEIADIIFLVDSSSSISSMNFTIMKNFMMSVVNETSVGENQTRYGLIVFSTNPKSIFTLNEYKSKRDVNSAIIKLGKPSGDTYTGKALNYSLGYFGAQYGGRKALKVPQWLMVITDGEATDEYYLAGPAKELQDNGIIVYSIGVVGANKQQLELMAGDTNKVFFVDDFHKLDTLHKNISNEFCNIGKPVCEQTQGDLVLLIDSSGSISSTDFTVMKKFATDLVSSFNIAEQSFRVGVAQFSSGPKKELFLNEYYTEAEVNNQINNMTQISYTKNIGKALDYVRTEYFQPARGSRINAKVSQNLVVITDGRSDEYVVQAAEHLRAMNIEVFAIGIGKDHKPVELGQITLNPERVFSVQDFASLDKIKKKLVDTICSSKETKAGCTIDIAMGFDITRRATAQGLFDGQAQLQAFLPQIIRYVSSLKDLCCVAGSGSIETNIGFRIVEQNGKVLYDFNFDRYDEKIVENVMALQTSQTTYFNSFLLRSFHDKFQKSNAGVKVLVIFSDGLDDDVMKLEQESDLLRIKGNGISALLTVALEGVQNANLLQMVEFGRGFGYKQPLNIGMHNLGNTLLTQIDTVAERECCNVMCKCNGHEGIRGNRGRPGTKSQPGLKGHPGFPGEEGGIGERGPPGPTGPQGLQGCPGRRGLKGSRGYRGDRGDDGDHGLDGVDGEQGLIGTGGAAGERGNPGSPGNSGLIGEPGVKGQRGLRGDPGDSGVDSIVAGPKGGRGNPGLPGDPGEEGGRAESGIVGNPGPQGRRGLPGPNGTPGDPGDVGLQGIPGPSGPQGIRGDLGQPGPRGLQGLPGPQGTPGTIGGKGSTGRRGMNGQKGQPGDPGDNGALGTLGPRGMPGLDGSDGHGPPGPQGMKGEPGFHGYPGLQGESGDFGVKGGPGPKGNRGRGGNSGRSGESGDLGSIGPPGHTGSRGRPGERAMSECQLTTYIRDNCACSQGQAACPAYPTELVFALDMSQDVEPATFERMRSALLSILDDVAIAESNCPTGARVAVVSYSANTKYLIRFHDYQRKQELLEAIQNIALEQTSNRRHLGEAMRFVGRHVFKRTRKALTMRKVAVFFTNGPSVDSAAIVTAAMEFKALNIAPAVIAMRNSPDVQQAFEADDTGSFILVRLGDRSQDQNAVLTRIKNCVICYDHCKPAQECDFTDAQRPLVVDMDLTLVVDGSREIRADQYAGVQELLGSVVKQVAWSPKPSMADGRARVALLQTSGSLLPQTSQAVKVEFDLQKYHNHIGLQTHLRSMQQQGGVSSLGQTLEYALSKVFLKATRPRKSRVVLAVVGAETAHWDQAKLAYISQKAKCQGVSLFVITVGDHYNSTQVEELASTPSEQHLLHLWQVKEWERGYAQRFFRAFLRVLSKGMNSYPPAHLKLKCELMLGQEHRQGQGQAEWEVWREEEEEEYTDEEEFLEHTGVFQTQIALDQVDTIQAFSRGDGATPLPRPQPNSNDACFFKQDKGGCQNYTLKWYFDTTQSECSRFWYGGCGGNGNRFETKETCEGLCLRRNTSKTLIRVN